jgi:glycosyltransferase involved in cell wall biosynthesis
MIDVSIIVPIYNSDRWLKKCVNSIINQTFTNFELILVNDGSTDESVKICKEYARSDKRVIFLSKSNGGPSSARNFGLGAANGEYVYFLDSDDYVNEHLLEYCMDLVRKVKYNILIFDTTCELSSGDLLPNEYTRTLPSNCSLMCSEVLQWYIDNEEYRPTVWLYMYKRDFIVQNNLKFKGRIYEDDAFNYRAHTVPGSCFYLPLKLHYHVIHTSSITGLKIENRNIEGSITLLEDMLDIYTNNGAPENHKKLLKFYAWFPLKLMTENAVFDKKLIIRYSKILTRNLSFCSLSMIKSLVKYILRFGKSIA